MIWLNDTTNMENYSKTTQHFHSRLKWIGVGKERNTEFNYKTVGRV